MFFDKHQDVLVGVAAVAKLIHVLPHEVDAKAAYSSLFQRGGGISPAVLKRIEGRAAVFENDLSMAFGESSHLNLDLFGPFLIGVPNDVQEPCPEDSRRRHDPAGSKQPHPELWQARFCAESADQNP